MHLLRCSQSEHHISQYLQCCDCELDSVAGFQLRTLAHTVSSITGFSDERRYYHYTEHTLQRLGLAQKCLPPLQKTKNVT